MSVQKQMKHSVFGCQKFRLETWFALDFNAIQRSDTCAKLTLEVCRVRLHV